MYTWKVRHPVDRIISDFHYRRSGAYLVEIKQKNPEVITPHIHINKKIDNDSDIDTLTMMLILNSDIEYNLDFKDGNNFDNISDRFECAGALARLWLPQERLWKLCSRRRPRMLLDGGTNFPGWGGGLRRRRNTILFYCITIGMMPSWRWLVNGDAPFKNYVC